MIPSLTVLLAAADQPGQPLGTLALAVCLTLLAVGVAASSSFSGVETGIYTLNRVRLHVLAHQGNRRAVILQELLHRPNRLLGTLLIGNNMANYLTTYSLAVPLESMHLHHAQLIILESLLITPLLFIFGEVLPKDLFRGYTDRLTYPFASPLQWFQRLLWWTGLLPLIDGISSLMARWFHSSELTGLTLHPRRVMTYLIKEGVGHGVISPYQSNMVERVLQFGEQTVQSVMVEWPDVAAVSVGDEPAVLWRLADRSSHSRFPLLDASGRPVGAIDIYDVLMHDPPTCPPLATLARDLPRVAPDTPLRQALALCQKHQVTMALVARGQQPLGIVTLKDLVEPIIGDVEVW